MKRRAPDPREHEPRNALAGLAQAIALLPDPGQVAAFLQDLCTPAELEAMTDRWRVVPLLLQGVPYREIHDRTLVSVTTIGRVARTLDHGAGGYAAAIKRRGSRGGGHDESCNPRGAARPPAHCDPEIRPPCRTRASTAGVVWVELAREPGPPVL